MHATEQMEDGERRLASRMLLRLLRGYPKALAVHLWDGSALNVGAGVPAFILSRNQYEYAKDEIRRQGLAEQVTVELRDYRDLPCDTVYDKVVSVGMFEHVGLKNLPEYFATVRRVLKVDGIFLNHGITTDQPGWTNDASSRFINRHVFPDGELDTVSNIQGLMEAGGFEIFDMEGLRPAIRAWLNRHLPDSGCRQARQTAAASANSV